jgi:hypothetical protein
MNGVFLCNKFMQLISFVLFCVCSVGKREARGGRRFWEDGTQPTRNWEGTPTHAPVNIPTPACASIQLRFTSREKAPLPNTRLFIETHPQRGSVPVSEIMDLLNAERPVPTARIPLMEGTRQQMVKALLQKEPYY